MPVTPVSGLEEFHAIIAQDEPTVFDFWATWCGPCRVISPVFERLSELYPNIKFYKVDTDQAVEIAQEAGIRAMPTFIVFRNGRALETVLGARPQNLQALIAKHATKPLVEQ